MINYDEKVKVTLKFSHVHKERKYREYIFDDDEQSEVSIVLATLTCYNNSQLGTSTVY